MKIKDIVLSEAETSQQFPLSAQAQAALGNFQGRRPGQATQPKAAPAKRRAPAKKPAQAAGKPAADPSLDPYDPYKDTNVQMTPPSTGSSAELDRLKQLAIGGNQPPVAAATTPEPAADPGAAARAMAANSSPTPEPSTNALGVTAQPGGGGYGNFTAQATPEPGQATQPRDASTVPDAARGVATTPQVSPDTGLSTAPKPVTTGTGGKTNVVTGSDDEMAWRAKNPNWNMTGAQYPGAGNWDPKTGRSKQAQAQADANAAAFKGFLNKINPFAKKEQPAAAPAQQGQGTQAAPTASPPQTPGGYGRFTESELGDIKKLAGLK